MKTIALKNDILNKISKIKDKKTLESIQELINKHNILDKNGALILTSEMNQLIQLSKDKYEKGEFKNHDNLMQELELWKKEKV
jgi:hypothetical protein